MKILITGSNGLVGSSIKRNAISPLHQFSFATRKNADLRDTQDVKYLFEYVGPDVVIHTSAKVGGIGGNEAKHEEFLHDNLLINANVIRACVKHKVKQLFAFSSVCVFPNDIGLLSEERMHDGPVYDSNFAYGYAKRMVDVHIRAAEKQYGVKNWCSVIPGNLFGEHDNYSIEYGHIIPSLMHKLYIAKKNNTPLIVWGDGLSMREFIYVDDLSNCILQLIGKEIPNRILISGRKEFSIKEIVDILCDIAQYWNVEYDPNKPNGQRRRPSSKKVIDSLLNFEYTDIREGLQKTWQWFTNNYPNVRTKYAC